MNSLSAAILVNLIGFAVGVVLYGLLAVMVLRHRPTESRVSGLLLLTAALGLLWNMGELFELVARDMGTAPTWPFLAATAHSALGFLPSVVLTSSVPEKGRLNWPAVISFAVSTVAAALHYLAAISGGDVPSQAALILLTATFLIMTAALFVFRPAEAREQRPLLIAALLIFALSSFHLSIDRVENSWLVEMAAHQSSLPLALVILYRNYRFAFADLFLKRSISLIFISLIAFFLYLFVAAPILDLHALHGGRDVQATGVLIALWIATALAYPVVHRASSWLVDTVILGRPDYEELRRDVAMQIEAASSESQVLDVLAESVAAALTATQAVTRRATDRAATGDTLVTLSRDGASIGIPATDPPGYVLEISHLKGGRKLLSEETSLLQALALITSRRIDALRVTEERFRQEAREREFSRLASEAQLAALRAQINPHFLFNALTTIGYLIKATPDRAVETLFELTRMLRRLFRNTSGFCTLGDELTLISSYLAIERERFEERLQVEIAVPEELRGLTIPSLILQPLVENSIKHAISENRAGGKVAIAGRLIDDGSGPMLELSVTDSGPGGRVADIANSNGVGLKNVRERLRVHYGTSGVLDVVSNGVNGTRAEIRLPVENAAARRAA